MSGQETPGLVLPPPGDSSDAHPPQPPATSVTGKPGPGDPRLCGVSCSLTLFVTLPTSPVTHPQGGNSWASKVPPVQVNTGSAGMALLGNCDVYTCVCLFSLKFYTRSGGGRGCQLRPPSCMIPWGLASSLCCPSGAVPMAAAPQGGYEPSNPTQRLGRQRPGAACLLQDWVSSSHFSRKNFVVWGPGSGLLSRLTPEVIPKRRPTALLPLTSSRTSGESRKGQGAAAAPDSGPHAHASSSLFLRVPWCWPPWKGPGVPSLVEGVAALPGAWFPTSGPCPQLTPQVCQSWSSPPAPSVHCRLFSRAGSAGPNAWPGSDPHPPASTPWAT